MDNVSIVVNGMAAAVAFFEEIGLTSEGGTTVEGPWVGRIIGLENVKADIVMMGTAGGTRLELTSFHHPAAVGPAPDTAPANTLGIRRLMFTVDDLRDVLGRLQAKHGAELIGEVVNYEDVYLLCYLRGPEGIMIALAQELG